MRRQRPSTGEAFTLGVVAAVLAALVVPFWLLWDWDVTDESKAFVDTPEFVLWLLLFSAQAAAWVGAAWWIVSTLSRRVRDLRRLGALPRSAVAAIVGSTVVLALAAIILVFGSRYGLFYGFKFGHIPQGGKQQCGMPTCNVWPLYGHEVKVNVLVGTGLLIGFLAIAGMWLTAVGLDDLALRARARVSRVRRFVALRSELTGMLAVAGVLIGFATLTGGALRAAVLATNDNSLYRQKAVTCLEGATGKTQPTVAGDFDKLIARYPECKPLAFDHQYVLEYGLLFSGLLAIAFAPSFLSMRNAGARLREATYPLPHPSDPGFFEAVDKRRKFDDLLQTNLSATGTFKAGVAIVTPLAASIISTLLSG